MFHSDLISDMDEGQKKVLDRLQAQCSKREYCVSDVRRKALTALDGDAVRAGEVVDSLVADRFVSDLRYASAFARETLEGDPQARLKLIKFALSRGYEYDEIKTLI